MSAATVENNGITLPPGTEIMGHHETPVYADDGKTVEYTCVTLRLKIPIHKQCPWCQESYTTHTCPNCHRVS